MEALLKIPYGRAFGALPVLFCEKSFFPLDKEEFFYYNNIVTNFRGKYALLRAASEK